MIRRKDRGLIAFFQTDHTKGNGCGFNLGNTSYTLQAVNGGGMAIAYRLDPESSNSMKSKNPFSGYHEERVCHTLDCTQPNPSKKQGGMAIVEKLL